jgi:hypothetical protein
MPVIPGVRQGDLEFKSRLGYYMTRCYLKKKRGGGGCWIKDISEDNGQMNLGLWYHNQKIEFKVTTFNREPTNSS